MSYEIIKKCGTNCLVKQGEPHRIIGTVNDEVASILTDALKAQEYLVFINRSAEFKRLLIDSDLDMKLKEQVNEAF